MDPTPMLLLWSALVGAVFGLVGLGWAVLYSVTYDFHQRVVWKDDVRWYGKIWTCLEYTYRNIDWDEFVRKAIPFVVLAGVTVATLLTTFVVGLVVILT